MPDPVSLPTLSTKLVDALHMEAMLLADETRAYFDGPGRVERNALDPHGRVLFACESLKATTRLMQVITWLTLGRMPGSAITLEPAVASSDDSLGRLPTPARRLVLAGIELHERARRIAAGHGPDVTAISPARSLFEKLERAF